MDAMQAVPAAPPHTPPMQDGEIRLKAGLEAALRGTPGDDATRRLYFSLLQRIAGARTGLLAVHLPELRAPLFLRCGTTDAASLHQVFAEGKYALAPNHAPAHILDLGAYVGYAAVFLASRHPAARILCVEPVPANHRLLLLNTLPYRGIATLNAAAWRSTGRLARTDLTGDWGSILAATGESGLGAFPCYSVADMLRIQGWERADTVKCSIQGSEKAVFADPAQDWISGIDALAVETHDRLVPDCSGTVAACFDPAQYAHTRQGAVDVWLRRSPRTGAPAPRAIALAQSDVGVGALRLENVAQAPWAFFLFDERGLQLHPNPPNRPPARAVFTQTCDGQSGFSADILLAGPPCDDVLFRVAIRRVADGAVLLDASRRVRQGAPLAWSERTPLLNGPHELTLQTEMAPEAVSNANAWARWIEPRLS
ncbi:MAG: FkbM family methyltransferase [Acidisphaera sp.]|nr:FkbM family methyltransferase [Acidisphaera sp.]